MIGRNDPCPCGSGKKWKKCHFPNLGPQKSLNLREEYFKKYRIILKTPRQIEGISKACELTAKILEETCKKAVAGITTGELNDFAHKLHEEAGAIPAPLNYGHPPFPKSICTSLNDIVCHGIPGDYRLKEGDIMNIDISCILNGYYGDCSKMVTIGKISEEKQKVFDISYECLMGAIALLKPSIPLCTIGNCIHDYAEKQGCSVVDQFVGHGVGIDFHEPPQIPHFRNNSDILLQPGMTFTIEPMINAGSKKAVIDETDHWTARTIDGKPSAQWEHTILITEKGHKILTPWKK